MGLQRAKERERRQGKSVLALQHRISAIGCRGSDPFPRQLVEFVSAAVSSVTQDEWHMSNAG